MRRAMTIIALVIGLMGVLLLPAQAHGGSGSRNEGSDDRGHDREDHDGNRGDHRGIRNIRLSGEFEAPAGTGDPDGTGRARVRIRPAEGTVCYLIKVRNIDAVTAAHIHSGLVGVDGPVVVDLSILTAETKSSSNGTATWYSRCVTGLATALLTTIKENKAGYYVNVHTTAYPDGAVRGQLGKA